jgi:ribose 5-phosphate isomerase B
MLNNMKLYFASDHAGFEMKKELIHYARNLGYVSEDCGAFEYDETDDYPDFIKIAAQKVSDDPVNSKAVILGGSGQGEDMVADKLPHVRSAVYYGGPLEIVKLSREHNDANVLSLGARFINIEEAKKALELWLATEFSGEERHQRRIDKIDEL